MSLFNTLENTRATQSGSIFSDRRKSQRDEVTVERRQRQYSPSDDWYLRVGTVGKSRAE